jgi:Leucine-rich repeat (LRR) protein
MKNNKIVDLFEIEGLSNSLEYLQLENNLIEDIENITFLSCLFKLKRLCLNGNPICKKNNFINEIYSNLPWILSYDIPFTQQIKIECKDKNGDIDFDSKVKKSSAGVYDKDFKDLKESNVLDIVSNSKSPILAYKEIKEIHNEYMKGSKLDLNEGNEVNDGNSYITTSNNSLLTSTVSMKFNESSSKNIFNINFSKLKPVKLKEKIEKEKIKEVFAKHNQFLNVEMEGERIKSELERKEKK